MSKYFFPLVIKAINKPTKDSVEIEFFINDTLQDQFTFVSGQYLTILHHINGEEIRRSYSINTTPHENKLSVTVKKIEGGVFSSFANENLKEGDILQVMPPTGNFTIDPTDGFHYVFFAAGSGITPIISIIKDILYNTKTSTITLFYGNKDIESILFKSQLDDIKNTYMNRTAVNYVFSKEKGVVPLFKGRINGEKCVEFGKYLCDFTKCHHFFICGPNEMIFDISDTLLNIGIPKEAVHVELFNTKGIALPSIANTVLVNSNQTTVEKSKVSIKIDGNIIDLALGYDDQNILDAALAEGADLPFACKGGVCSTCKAKVIQGTVVMDVNYSLEPDEIAEGFVLLCQSHPVSEVIEIDFDLK